MANGKNLGDLIAFLQTLSPDVEIQRMTKWTAVTEPRWIAAEADGHRESGRTLTIEIALPDRMVMFIGGINGPARIESYEIPAGQ